MACAGHACARFARDGNSMQISTYVLFLWYPVHSGVNVGVGISIEILVERIKVLDKSFIPLDCWDSVWIYGVGFRSLRDLIKKQTLLNQINIG